ncbi:hypothetical protein GCM10008959_25980 [Deinococcus seoulensis]|uniref:Uncharacterized protein n=1 Tax=Deinococcus seoulensis TaxID=1837379 RepID=A0ABQ2RT37_9DEIO|nr:hypothetical protein [Deinococcus seoulensis]GGR62739.1 hypothetical protein GCM10008959_25980 [Deinococcus seoulensis]
MNYTIQQLATRTRQVNARNDWGTDFTLAQVPQFIALIHSEITEAHLERDRDARARELGDVIVRCMDLCELINPGALQHALTRPRLTSVRPALPARLVVRATRTHQDARLHALASAALETYRKAPDASVQDDLIRDLARLLEETTHVMSCELPYPGVPTGVVRGILDANAGRGKRHGGRRC